MQMALSHMTASGGRREPNSQSVSRGLESHRAFIVSTSEVTPAMNPRLSTAILALFVLLILDGCGAGDRSSSQTITSSSSPTPSATPSPSSNPTPTPEATPRKLDRLLVGGGVDTAGTYIVDLQRNEMFRTAGRVVWLPGNRAIAADCCSGPGEVDLLDLELQTSTTLIPAQAAGIAVSPDGSEIAYSLYQASGAPSGGIYVMSLETRQQHEIAQASASELAWSKSGRYLGFVEGYGLKVLDVTTGDMSVVSPMDPGVRFAWSPVTDVLQFAGVGGVAVYDPSTTTSTVVTSDTDGWPLVWSPDGSRIVAPYGDAVLTSPGGSLELNYVLTVDGSSAPTALPPSRFVSWSPDGRKLAYISEGCATSDWNVYVINADGTGELSLTTSPAVYKETPIWAQGGSSIIYSEYASAIKAVELATGETRTLASGVGDALVTLDFGATASPDGRFFAFRAASGGHGICD